MFLHAHIRLINLNDAEATLNIYRQYVEHTAISFEYECPTLHEWEQRIQTVTETYPWIVCEVNNEIVGYAYASQHKNRTAYQWSVDSAIYFSHDFVGQGLGTVLYRTLFDILRLLGYVNVIAGITMPNEKSERLHSKCGFYEIACYNNIGYKFGQWRSVKWFEMHLTEHRIDPPVPKSIHDAINTEELNRILHSAQ